MKKLGILLLSGAALLAAADKIVGGPYVVHDTARSATVVWVVQSDEVTLTPPDGSAALTAPALRVEKTTFTGLRPGTHYDYQVPGHEGMKGSFQTPPTGAAPYHFVVFGDTRTRHDVARSVIQAILKNGVPDFVLHSGDMVADGNNTALWPIFFDIEKDLLRQAPIFPALGNHERDCRNFYDFFQMTAPYYSFNWGNGHFIVLDSDLANAAPTKIGRDAFWTEQTRWLEADLEASQNAEFRFVLAHHPPFTAVAHRQGANPQMTALTPMFEKYHVTAAFFGHDHNYQRYLKNGIQYIVSGGGGAPLYDVGNPDKSIIQKAVSVENFVAVSVDGKKIHMDAYAVDGKKIDEVDIQH